MADVNEQLYDLLVGHQIGLQRLTTRTVQALVRLVDRVERDVLAKLAEGGTELERARLARLLDALGAIYVTGYAELADRLERDAADLAQYEAEYVRDAVLKVLPPEVRAEVEFVVPSPQQLRSAVESRPFQGRLLREWGRDLGEGARQRVSDAVRMAAVEGETVPQLVRRVRGTRAAGYKDGITQMSRRGAESLVRTAMNHVANHAREAVIAENDDLADRVRWVSTLDTRTTPVCRERDGKTWPVGSGPRPPAHWGCRSTVVPVIKSWRQLGIDLPELPEGTRASMSGQVPASETYQTWLERQSAETQDEALGPTRGALFRGGGLTVDRFVDPAGRQLTLAQLRARDAAAFRRAGL